MSNLISEIALRLAKAAVAAILAVVLYVILVGPLGVPASSELFLLAWISAAVLIVLVQTSPI